MRLHIKKIFRNLLLVLILLNGNHLFSQNVNNRSENLQELENRNKVNSFDLTPEEAISQSIGSDNKINSTNNLRDNQIEEFIIKKPIPLDDSFEDKITIDAEIEKNKEVQVVEENESGEEVDENEVDEEDDISVVEDYGNIGEQVEKRKEDFFDKFIKKEEKQRKKNDEQTLVPKYNYVMKADSMNAPLETNINSRMFVFSIPAPRGQITDRYGRTFSQNKISYYAGIKFPYNQNLSEAQILDFGRANINRVAEMLGKTYDITDEDILNHYQNRRWILMVLPGIITMDQAKRISKLKSEEIKLHPIYLRTYPKEKLASHIIGYVGKKNSMPRGKINPGEPLWEATEGRDGLEKSLDSYLTGKDGKLQLIYDDDKKKLISFVSEQAVPGNNVVLSLDIDMQKIAERVLSKRRVKSAFVLMDVKTGEILAMASWPHYNPNDFVPFITKKRSEELFQDPKKIMFPRAFMGEYPPASTFKVLTALACLKTGKVSEYSKIGCPGFRYYGRTKFRNWHKSSEGDMTVTTAIMRSCNTWFYEASRRVGSDSLVDVALNFGLGQKTKIPLYSETAGFVPTNSYYLNKYGHKIIGGNLANMSIGQGELATSPLQVARMMAGVANSKFLPPAVLVKQIQDHDNKVIKDYNNLRLQPLRVNEYYLKVVKEGMYKVVNSKYGTGKRAYNRYGTIAGKTGTGQWKLAIKQNVAWFAGFIPYKYPEFSYALLYEGRPGESVSGGKKAAPIVADFFNRLASLRYRRQQDKNNHFKDNMIKNKYVKSKKKKSSKEEPGSNVSATSYKKQKHSVSNNRIGNKSKRRRLSNNPQIKPRKKGFFRRLFGRDR